MLIDCVICSDLFTHGDDVSATPCGHVFHFSCLIQWMERSNSCPQCRAKTTEKKLFKLFFNIASGETVEDLGSLQNQIESLKFKLRCKDVDIKKARDEVTSMKEKNQGLRDECIKLEKDGKQNKKTISALKDQLNYLQKQEKEAKEIREECRNLRKHLAELQSVENVVSGTLAEVEELLSSYTEGSDTATKSLATYCVMLKRELHSAVETKRCTRNEFRSLQQEASRLESQLKGALDKLEMEKTHVQVLKEDLQRTESENESLIRKIHKLEQAITSPSGDAKSSALKRIICESPCPETLKKPRLSDPSFDELTVLSSTVKTESPYLNIKSSSVGLTPLRPSVKENRRMLMSHGTHDLKFSIFKKSRLSPSATTTTTTNTKNSTEEAYNGLGGHSKSDLYPSPLVRPAVQKKQRKVNKMLKVDSIPNLQKYFKDPIVIDSD